MEFHKVQLEKTSEWPVENDCVDLVISNCVVNLVTDKAELMRGVYRVLRQGGSVYEN